MLNVEKNFQTWVRKITHKVFSFRNGYFEFPYQFTHPKILVNSIKAFSFMKHDAQGQSVTSNNPFFSGALYYFEIEEGLWITIFDTFCKRNIAFINKSQVPVAGYYNLSFVKFKDESGLNYSPFINNNKFMTSDWTLYPSGSEVNAYHCKNSRSLIACYTFDEKWLENNLQLSALAEQHPLNVLFKSDFGCNPIIKNPVKDAEHTIESLHEIIKNISGNPANKFLFKSKCKMMIAEFFDGLSNNLSDLNYCEQDKNLISELLAYLENNYCRKFPGIEEVASHLNTSPTKIKLLFKEWYGCGIANWFRSKQMELAAKLIKEEKMQIQDVAAKFGYSSSSKFTNAFKKHHGINPSQVN